VLPSRPKNQIVSRTARSVCLITKDYPPCVPGGIPRAVQMQAHHLAAAGVEVHVITKSQTGADGQREDRGVIVHELCEPGLAAPPGLYYLEIPLWSFVTAAKFAELDATVRFDVVETPDYRGEALHLVTRPETALIVWLHSTLMVAWNCEPDYARTPGDDAWHALEMAALERADLLLAPSQLLLDTTAEFLGERMRPAELMPYLFDATQFPVRRRPCSDGPIRVLFYGRLEARKNPELALHAVAAARAAGHRVELTVMGHDHWNYRGRVLAPLQAELGLPDVSYIPHADVETVRTVLADTDVAILASRFDNSPLTIFEALSSGVPVITSDRVGTASWLEADNGLLALPVDDPAHFGRQAAAALTDLTWMSSGARAAARIRELFSPVAVTERLLGCYDRLLAARTRPAIDGARRAAVLAFADELLTDPSLLRAWARTFDGADEITLVIHVPSWSAEEVDLKLGPVVAQAGLDSDDAADLLAYTVDSSVAVECHLAAGVNAILSRHRRPAPFDQLPMVDETSLAALREDLDQRSPHAMAA
jgi:glycosyltransferase involved in cell wall biosynthesis